MPKQLQTNNAVPVLTEFHQTREELGQRKDCTLIARLPYARKPARKLKKRSYILDINDNSVKLHIHLANDGHWQRKWITVSSSSADLHPRQKLLNESCILSACLPQCPVSMATIIERRLWLNPSNWSVRFLSIEGQVNLAVEQDSSLTQYILYSRKNFELSIEEHSGRSVSSSVLQFPRI